MLTNRIVHNRCTIVGGRYVEVGRFADSGKSFVTRYDKSGRPTSHITFDSNYRISAVTSYHDDRRENDFVPNDDYDDANIFVAGSVICNGIVRPLILNLSGDLLEVNNSYVCEDVCGYLTDIVMDDYYNPNKTDNSVIACGAIVDSAASVVSGLIIVQPLFGSNPSSDLNFPEEVIKYEYSQPFSFRKVTIDHVGFAVCAGFISSNNSENDFDFLVKYLIREKDEVLSGEPLVEFYNEFTV